MKTKTKIHLSAILLLTITMFIGCSPDLITVSPIKTFYSEAANDGIVINSSPKQVKDYDTGPQGKRISMGWNASGYAMHGFLSFDVSEILPKDGYNLVIESATLSVFEENTNLLPFSSNKIVECYVVDYGTLTADAYAKSPAYDCGVLTSSGANVLKEYSLNVIGGIVEFLATNPSATKYQFRLQFLPDGNVSATSASAQAMWSIFSGDETKLTDYRPKLVIKYHHQKK